MSTPNYLVYRIILAVGLLAIFESPVTPATPPESTWWQHGQHWYKLYRKAECWNEARNICEHENGYLAVVNNQTEADALLSHFHAKGEAIGALCQDAVHVGIHDLFSEGDWVTLFNEPIAKVYNVWSSKWGRQPDNFGGAQNCGTLYRDGKLNDVPCSIKLPFFCERNDAPILIQFGK